MLDCYKTEQFKIFSVIFYETLYANTVIEIVLKAQIYLE